MRVLFTSIVVLSGSWCSGADAQWLEETRAIMGTRIHIELEVKDDAVPAGKAAMDEVFSEFTRLDAMLSPFKNDSELSRLNREGYQQAVTVPPELFEVIERSLDFSRMSEGAFDVTFASVGRYYDYRKHQRPDAQTIAEALPAISYRHLELDARRSTVHYTHPGVYVDLGGIAKGYAVDRAIGMLLARNYKRMLVTAGGDSRIVGDRDDKPWRVGIKSPDGGDKPAAIIPLADVSVSTSGDYERYFDEDGVRYHHIIDPKTGDSSRALRSVTILGPNATTTDGLSTTVFVMGLEKGMRLINSIPDVDAVIIDPKGEIHYSKSLERIEPTN